MPGAEQRTVAALARRFSSARKPVDQVLDWLRFRVDTFPWTYQPTSNGVRLARRADGTATRWEKIRNLANELGVRTAMDVGCNGGWFVMQFAQMGVLTVGVDSDPRFSRMLLYESGRRKFSNVGVLTMRVDARTVSVLPAADAVLFLSVWHHLVRESGRDEADDVLKALWAKANTVLFFDSGEQEMPASFQLPSMAPDPEAWLREHLGRTCGNSEVHHLGKHAAFAPDGTRCDRNLFAVVRLPNDGSDVPHRE